MLLFLLLLLMFEGRSISTCGRGVLANLNPSIQNCLRALLYVRGVVHPPCFFKCPWPLARKGEHLGHRGCSRRPLGGHASWHIFHWCVAAKVMVFRSIPIITFFHACTMQWLATLNNSIWTRQMSFTFIIFFSFCSCARRFRQSHKISREKTICSFFVSIKPTWVLKSAPLLNKRFSMGTQPLVAARWLAVWPVLLAMATSHPCLMRNSATSALDLRSNNNRNV